MSYYAGPVAIVPANTVLSFPIGENPPTNVPLELQPYYKEDVWGARITAVVRKASRYHKRGLEWIWLIVGFGALIAGPIAVYYVALHALPEDSEDKDDHDHDHDNFHTDFDRYWKARLISFATWIGLMILVFMPMRIWKSSGKKAVNQMLQSWESEERAIRPPNAPLPSLRMKMPGVISKHIKLFVMFPASTGPSMYQPGAPVPPFIANPPSDPAAQMYYQPTQQPPQGAQTAQWGPPMSGFVNQAPASTGGYNANGSQAPYNAPGLSYGAIGNKAENPFEDFEHVKV